jgi:hypothetical protein
MYISFVICGMLGVWSGIVGNMHLGKKTHLLGTLGGLCCTILRIKEKRGKFANGVNAWTTFVKKKFSAYVGLMLGYKRR